MVPVTIFKFHGHRPYIFVCTKNFNHELFDQIIGNIALVLRGHLLWGHFFPIVIEIHCYQHPPPMPRFNNDDIKMGCFDQVIEIHWVISATSIPPCPGLRKMILKWAVLIKSLKAYDENIKTSRWKPSVVVLFMFLTILTYAYCCDIGTYDILCFCQLFELN